MELDASRWSQHIVHGLLSKQGAVLGIDVGYSAKKATTCLCLLDWDSEAIRIDCRNAMTDEEDRRKALRHLLPAGIHLSSVAIDGPLTHDLRLIKHYRAAEALLSQGVFQKRGKAAQTNSGTGQQLHEQAILLAELVLNESTAESFSLSPATHYQPIHKQCIVEAFPNQFLASLLAENRFPTLSRNATDIFWELLCNNDVLTSLLSHLLPNRRTAFSFANCTNHEHRAGVVCALTALAVACQDYVLVGDPMDGYIVLPPTSLWGASAAGGTSWMEDALHTSIGRVLSRRRNHANHRQARLVRTIHQPPSA